MARQRGSKRSSSQRGGTKAALEGVMNSLNTFLETNDTISKDKATEFVNLIIEATNDMVDGAPPADVPEPEANPAPAASFVNSAEVPEEANPAPAASFVNSVEFPEEAVVEPAGVGKGGGRRRKSKKQSKRKRKSRRRKSRR